MPAELRIGILGAARIAGQGIVAPARTLGHRVVAVAARDRTRAEAFAAEHGVERVHDDYADVINDPDVDVVYNALVNSLHAPWNIAALRAGKHVLTEKPFAANATEAHRVRETARTAPGTIVEGFHYLHHPVNSRLRDLVTSGELGQIRRVDLTLSTPSPPGTDPRWSWELAGGATMDLGCYVLHAARQLGTWIGTPPELAHAAATLRSRDVDASMQVELLYGDIPGQLRWDMAAAERTMTWTVTGTRATATSPAFAVPQLDNRLLITSAAGPTTEQLGSDTSYTYQLAALAAALTGERAFPIDVDDAVANAELIDAVYTRAGLRCRAT